MCANKMDQLFVCVHIHIHISLRGLFGVDTWLFCVYTCFYCASKWNAMQVVRCCGPLWTPFASRGAYTGLFCVYLGLFCVSLGLFCMYPGLVCVDITLFGGCIGLSCVSEWTVIQMARCFWRFTNTNPWARSIYTGLFCVYIGLFCVDLGLLCVHRALLRV